MLLALAVAAPPADLAAVGIVASRDPTHSVALLRSGGRSRLVAVGDTAFGGKVAAIGAGVVALEFEGRRVELRLSAEAASPVAVARVPSSSDSDPNARVLQRRDVEKRLGEEAPRI